MRSPLLRDASWLTRERALAWATVLAIYTIAALLGLLAVTRLGTAPDPWQRPLGPDFVNIWTAGRMAIHGDAALAWDAGAHAAAMKEYFPPGDGFQDLYYPFFYPPPILLIAAPLSLLPYSIALMLWLSATGIACYAGTRALIPPSWPAAVPFVGFPALLVNAAHGQNGAFTAALLAGAAITMDRRPTLAGLCLGALSIKPQLALLVAPTLLAARRWDVLAWAALTVGAIGLASVSAFGVSSWTAFLASLHDATNVMELGLVSLAKMVSTFAAFWLGDLSLDAAWICQTVITLMAIGLCCGIGWRRPGGRAEVALIAAGALLATPYLFDYDLTLSIIPLAWIAAQANLGGFLPWEKLVIAVAFLLPLFARVFATVTSVSVAPLVLVAVFAIVVRRVWASGTGRTQPAVM
jgi:alpha-1,2-mannosyltransferase